MRRLRALVFYLAVAGAIAASNYFFFANPPATAPLEPDNAASPENSAAAVSRETLAASELLLVHSQTRPLFSPSRRRWVEPAQQAPAAAEPAAQPIPAETPGLPQPAVTETAPPDVKLIGIEMTPSHVRALLSGTGSADALWFNRGEKFEGWAVQTIDANSVEMALGERKITLELYPSPPLPVIGLDP